MVWVVCHREWGLGDLYTGLPGLMHLMVHLGMVRPHLGAWGPLGVLVGALEGLWGAVVAEALGEDPHQG